VTYEFSSMGAAPTVGSFYTVEGNVNADYNGNFEVIDSTTTSVTLSYPTDPGLWDLGTQTAIPGELTQVTASYEYLKTILPYVIEGTSLPSPYQVIQSQVTSGSNGTSTESDLATGAVDIILDIITNGPDPYLADGVRTPIGLSASAGNRTYAYDKLKANREFIAEEVVKVVPEVVGLDLEGKPEAVMYDRLTSLLCKAIQELAAKVEALEAKVK